MPFVIFLPQLKIHSPKNSSPLNCDKKIYLYGEINLYSVLSLVIYQMYDLMSSTDKLWFVCILITQFVVGTLSVGYILTCIHNPQNERLTAKYTIILYTEIG